MKITRLTNDQLSTLILLAAIIFGAWFRLMPAWFAGFPVNDGGLFYTMMADIQANHYLPPAFTTYNGANIPFAYPPLGLYVGAIFGGLFNISLIDILRWLPGIINALCVPAFYFFAKEILKDKMQSAFATTAYALTPHLTAWFSMGGGLTRSFGGLFMLIALAYVYRVFEREDKKSILPAIIFASLTVLSHTEAPIYTIAIAIYIWAMKSRSLKGLTHGVLIALGVLLVAGFWYGMVIYRHGVTPYLSAFKTGGQTMWAFLKLLNIDLLTEEFYFDFLGACGIFGIIFLVVKRQYFIPLMLVLIYLVQPRSAHTVGNIPLALAAGFFIVEVLFPALANFGETPNAKRGARIFLAIATPYILINSIYYGFTLSQKHISENEQIAMQWIKENTPKDSLFIVLTGEPEAMCDAIAEWFPALTERRSLNTLQGQEWLLAENFGRFIGRRARIQSCINSTAECVAQEAEYFSKSFDYIYISAAAPTKNCGVANASVLTTLGLVMALENEKNYSVAYRADAVILFEKK